MNRRAFLASLAGAAVAPVAAPKAVTTSAGINSIISRSTATDAVLTREMFERFARDVFRYDARQRKVLVYQEGDDFRPYWLRESQASDTCALQPSTAPNPQATVLRRHSIDRERDALPGELGVQPNSNGRIAFRKRRARRGRDKHRGKGAEARKIED